MKLEERVTVLCAQALATDDDAQVRDILTELRLVLHRHIEDLRSGLMIAYTASMIRPNSMEAPRRWPAGTKTAGDTQAASDKPARTWQQVVHEIARETNHGKALQLSLELTQLLQHHC